MKTCDVIIPAHNNAAVIKETLTALFSQSIPPSWSTRLVFVDDGSLDQTLSLARSIPSPSRWQPTCYLQQAASGAGAARNYGLKQSLQDKSDLVFFLGADIILLPFALSAHLQFHQKQPSVKIAALGHVDWDPRLNPTPLMAWLAHGGPQNNYDALLGQRWIDPQHFFYGSNLSLKTNMCPFPLFSPDFTSYGWEDLDAGRRLSFQGLTLGYLPEASGLHRHFYSAKNVYRRQYLSGFALPIYQSHYPSASLIPIRPRWHKLLHWLFRLSGLLFLLSHLASYSSTRFTFPRLFAFVTTAHFWQGLYSSTHKPFESLK